MGVLRVLQNTINLVNTRIARITGTYSYLFEDTSDSVINLFGFRFPSFLCLFAFFRITFNDWKFLADFRSLHSGSTAFDKGFLKLRYDSSYS